MTLLLRSTPASSPCTCGVAIEDVAAAAAVYEKVLAAGRGLSLDLAS
jgi:hypothetical protein